MSEKYTIYHNPRCRKSRETLELLNDHSDDLKIVEYLNNPPSEAELTKIIKMLRIKAEELIRKSEDLYKENYKDKDFSEAQWIKIMVKNPILIERPIVIKGNKAVIGRPPENVQNLF